MEGVGGWKTLTMVQRYAHLSKGPRQANLSVRGKCLNSNGAGGGT
jgi:hypothetical protein